MATLTLELALVPPQICESDLEQPVQGNVDHLLERELLAEGIGADAVVAVRPGKEIVAQELLSEQLATPPEAAMSEQSRGTAALRAAGLLAELGPEMKKLAEQSTMTLEEARAVLDRSGGQPLSELILEMRGPKE